VRVLIADDDRQILGALRIILSARGYDVSTARDGKEALDRAVSDHPDLVLLDLGMPGVDGLSVIQAIRGWSAVPILVVSGRTDSAEIVEALDLGADDYVTKPFATDELLARVRALARRPGTQENNPTVSFADVTIDLSDRRVTKGAGTSATIVRLTPTEWQILDVLVRNPGKLIAHDLLLSEIWGANHAAGTGYLRLYLSQLRKKLEPEPSKPRYLITEAGMGYRFEPER
jgi:two-component system KDP operon response regulator KdpE